MIPLITFALGVICFGDGSTPDARFYRLGAKSVTRERCKAGQPVIAVDFTRSRDINDETLPGLAVDMKDLITLDISGTAISDRSMSLIQALPKLTMVKLDFTRITDDGLKELGKSKSLKNVSAVATPVSDLGIEHLLRATGLESLNVSHTRITVRGIRAIANVKTLRELHIGSKTIENDDLRWLSNMHLKSLGLRGSVKLSEKALERVQKAVSHA